MEFTSFILGILSIIGIAAISMIVIMTIKLIKLTNYVNALDLKFERAFELVWEQFERAGRDVTIVEKTLMSQNELTRKETESAINELIKLIETQKLTDKKRLLKD